MSFKPQPPPDGDVDISWKLEVGTTVTFLAAAIVVALRYFARWKFSQKGWDDYVMVFALLLALVATIIDYVAADYGLGRHTFYLTPQQTADQQYYSFIAQAFCVQSLSFAKVSIVLSYIRVLRDSGKRIHQTLLWAIGILVIVVNTIVIITFYTACKPTRKSWDFSVQGTCWALNKRLTFFIFQGAFSAFTDFFLAFYPFVFLHKLQVRRSTKALILGLMGLGTVTGVFAVIRSVETGTQLHVPPTTAPDLSFGTILGLTWSGMERNIAILIGSIPALNPLVAPTARLITHNFSLLKSRLRLTGPQSYQLSDTSQNQKLPNKDSGKKDNAMKWGPNAGEQTANTSEEDILPVKGREIA